jgi:hypothetical protein
MNERGLSRTGGRVVWRTSAGERVLDGTERTLFVHAAAALLGYLLDEAREDDPDEVSTWHTGVALFDYTEPQARIVLLRDVVQALTDPTVPAPKLTATNEAGVHAVFRFLRGEIEMEMDCEDYCSGREPDLDRSPFILGHDPFYWRKLVLAAYLEARGPADPSDAGEAIPSHICVDMEEWDAQLECLADQIFWDRDWEMEEIMDLPPRQARAVKRLMGIEQDYFLAMPGGATNAEVRDAVAYLRRLAGEDRGDQEYARVTLKYEYDGLVGLEFADPELNQRHGCPVEPDQEVLDDAEVTVPLLLATDVARLLQKIRAAEQDEEKFWDVVNARERVSHYLHPYLPEDLQKQFRQSFQIAPGISADRDYGTTAAEFNVEKFAGVEFDEETRKEVRAATEWLAEFLTNLVSDLDYDFSDQAVRQALIQTAERMAQEFAGGEDDTAEH